MKGPRENCFQSDAQFKKKILRQLNLPTFIIIFGGYGLRLEHEALFKIHALIYS